MRCAFLPRMSDVPRLERELHSGQGLRFGTNLNVLLVGNFKPLQFCRIGGQTQAFEDGVAERRSRASFERIGGATSAG